MTFATGSLDGLRIGLSISESDELESLGFTPSGMNRLTVRFNDALLAQGATLAFGHDWRENGLMEAIGRSALSSFGLPAPGSPRPLILNLIPWPEKTRVAPEILYRMESILEVREAGLPEELAEFAPQAVDDRDLWLYLRARGLTHLRRQLTSQSQARICIGGKERQFAGRYPGILEEALLALRASQPIYLIGVLGGATRRIGEAILDGTRRPPTFGEGAFVVPKEAHRSLAEIYQTRRTRLSNDPLDDAKLDLEQAWRDLQGFGSAGLAANNGLLYEENRRLLETRFEEEAISLVLRGLQRIQQQKEEGR